MMSDGLAPGHRRWQRLGMPVPSDPQPRAAGAFIALAVIGGAIVGMFLHQPSAGVVGGGALGIAIALAFWFSDRRRTDV